MRRGIRKRISGLVLIAAGGAGAAWAQTAFLSHSEARRAMFGIEMAGVHEGDGAEWRECISPQGVTSYVFDGVTDEGRMRIDDDGRACFRYRSSNFEREGCFTIQREGRGFRFNSGDGKPDFVARSVRRGVRSCSGADAPIS
ncbi:MAG: hypothetical protein ABW199_00395 [Caulobacterales bacterium]